MTSDQVKVWLGLPPDSVMRDAEWWERVCEGMRDVPQPPPGPSGEHLGIFTAFLACSGPAPRRRRQAVKGGRSRCRGWLTR